MRITPTWFADKFVRGSSDVRVAVHLPPGVKPQEALYHSREFTAKAIFGDDEHTVVTWRWPKGSAAGPNMVGVSFPKRGLNRVVHMTRFGLLLRWFEQSRGTRMVAAIAFFIGLGVLFFRCSAGTGVSVFVALLVAFAVLFYVSAAAHLIAFVPLILLIIINEWWQAHRRVRYMPAIAQVEGGGIKRGLTAPEAAMVLELPLPKVLALVIFGLLKKRIVRQVSAEPLSVQVNDSFKVPQRIRQSGKKLATFYRRAARADKTVIHGYEHPFLFLLEANAGKPASEIEFTVPMKLLTERVAKRMKGFDLAETQTYYRYVIERAMLEAQSIEAAEPRRKVLDRDFQWLLMDDNYQDAFTRRGSYYRPMWTHPRSDGAVPPAAVDTAAAAPADATSISNVAGSFAGWCENTMGGLANAMDPSAMRVDTSTGVIDLSGADRISGDFFKALAESGGSGGGFSGGGCACAGCACACACAGGGR